MSCDTERFDDGALELVVAVGEAILTVLVIRLVLK